MSTRVAAFLILFAASTALALAAGAWLRLRDVERRIAAAAGADEGSLRRRAEQALVRAAADRAELKRGLVSLEGGLRGVLLSEQENLRDRVIEVIKKRAAEEPGFEIPPELGGPKERRD